MNDMQKQILGFLSLQPHTLQEIAAQFSESWYESRWPFALSSLIEDGYVTEQNGVFHDGIHLS